MKTTQDTYHTLSIDLDSANQRFDRFLRKFYKPYTMVNLPTLYSWIRKGYIRINNKKGQEDTKVILGDTIQINITKTIPLHQKESKHATHAKAAFQELQMIKSHIIHEDDNWLVFNKPPHMLMHPGSGNSKKAITMNDWLYSYLNTENQKDGKKLITQGSTFKPAFCFRLDKDTSGVLIAAKQYDALQYLNDLIRERDTTKRYIVVTGGKLPTFLAIDKPLFKGFHGEKGRAHMFVNYEKGLASQTHVYNLGTIQDKTLGAISLGLVRLMTGRMHQIRVHLVSEGFPVLGDKDYGNEAIVRKIATSHGITRQLLHSFTYTFKDMHNKKKEFIAPIPDDISKFFPTITSDVIYKKIQSILSSK